MVELEWVKCLKTILTKDVEIRNRFHQAEQLRRGRMRELSGEDDAEINRLEKKLTKSKRKRTQSGDEGEEIGEI